MPDKDLHIDFPDLAVRYLSGNATDAEVRALEEWVRANPQNREQFMAFKKAWMLSGVKDSDPVNVEANWQQTSAQLFDPARVVSLANRRRRWLGIAAAIAVLATAAILMIMQPWAPESFTVAATETSEQVELADGSAVVLNRAATLSYREEDRTRRVQLQGDAYFDVSRDENRPFIIQAGAVEIEVLGTSFYVDARAGRNEVRVTVASGRVAVRHQNQEAILEAGEMAVYRTDSEELIEAPNDDPNFAALKTRTLTFEDTPLSEVATTLNRQYSVTIQIADAELRDCPLTSVFRDKSLEAVLTLLESSLGITVERQGRRITLSGRCASGE